MTAVAENIIDVVSIKDFINSESSIGIGYKDYWKESNMDKNVFYSHEQLMTIERRIIWGASKIGMAKINEEHKTTELGSEALKYHIAGEESVYDSIKGLATDYKRQPACRIFKSVGNMGTHAGDPGAAARYTHVKGTPLLRAVIKDMKYVPMISDETGLEQPAYLSMPLPMVLINGLSNIGTGHSAYYDERDAREVLDWIEAMVNGQDHKIPDPICTTGCKVYKNPKNGYTYYESVTHREGAYDVITNLPPKTSSLVVIAKLEAKLPARYANKIQNGSEKDKSVYIQVPKGVLDVADYNKYGMRRARKETPYIWDIELDTMRMSSHEEIAIDWHTSRKDIIGKRINSELSDIDEQIRRIDLISRYYDEKMGDMTHNQIKEILGNEDSEIVLSQPVRVFLKENIDKSKKRKAILLKEHKILASKDIDKLVFKEARDIIVEQEKYFNSVS